MYSRYAYLHTISAAYALCQVLRKVEECKQVHPFCSYSAVYFCSSPQHAVQRIVYAYSVKHSHSCEHYLCVDELSVDSMYATVRVKLCTQPLSTVSVDT
jgi:hypothetical protein